MADARGKDHTMPAVTVEDRGAISIIRINRPERLNAISQAVAVEMQQAFKAFDADPNKRVAILSGAGDAGILLRRRCQRPAGAVARHPQCRLPDRQADHRRHVGLGGRRRHCHGDDVRPDGFHRRHPVLLPGSQAWHDRGRHQLPGQSACRTSWRWRSCCWAPRFRRSAPMMSGSSTGSCRNGEHETEALAMAEQLLELGAVGDQRIEAAGQ